MATADETLDVARAQLGNGPDIYRAWYPAGNVAWCCIFQSWVLSQVGIPTHYAWVSALFDQYRAEGRTFAPFQAQPGDLVAFDYDGGGRSAYDHIAMVEAVTADGIVAINGNWENKVQRVLHRWGAQGFSGGLAEIARPAYSTPTPPAPIPTEETDVRRFIRAKSRPEVYMTDLMTKVHMTSEQSLADMNYALTQSGIPPLAPPAGSQVETINGVAVWVVSDSFAATIPTVK